MAPKTTLSLVIAADILLEVEAFQFNSKWFQRKKCSKYMYFGVGIMGYKRRLKPTHRVDADRMLYESHAKRCDYVHVVRAVSRING